MKQELIDLTKSSTTSPKEDTHLSQEVQNNSNPSTSFYIPNSMTPYTFNSAAVERAPVLNMHHNSNQEGSFRQTLNPDNRNAYSMNNTVGPSQQPPGFSVPPERTANQNLQDPILLPVYYGYPPGQIQYISPVHHIPVLPHLIPLHQPAFIPPFVPYAVPSSFTNPNPGSDSRNQNDNYLPFLANSNGRTEFIPPGTFANSNITGVASQQNPHAQSSIEEENSVSKAKKSKIVHSCKDCGKIFKRKQSLQTHTNVHLNLKPFECFLCGKNFNAKQNYLRHERSHLKKRPSKKDGKRL